MNNKKLVLSVQNLVVEYKIQTNLFSFSKKNNSFKAVNNVSFDVFEGDTFGIVGESGCGKTSIARSIMHIIPPTKGEILWLGENLSKLSKKNLRNRMSELQMIFQDPLGSLNPRMTVGEIISEPLVTHYPQLSKNEVKIKVNSIMDKVGLLPSLINRYPHEFSGGQCQRIGIARALITEPKLIICDEPVSSLDVSIQSQILNLLKKLQKELLLTLIFISHDLSVVKYICNKIMVLYLGKIIEISDNKNLFTNPKNSYTQELISSIPIPDPKIELNKTHKFL